MAPDEDGAVATKPPAPAASAPMAAGTAIAPATYPEWVPAVQAIYGGGPATPGTPQVFCPTSSSSSPSPYTWGNQSVTHGAPISYASLNPHGVAYTQPSMSLGANMAPREIEAKPFEGSDVGLKKTYDDSLGNACPVTGNCGDGTKATFGPLSADHLGNAGFLSGNCGVGDKATSGSVNVDAPHMCNESGGEKYSKNTTDVGINPCDLSLLGKRSYDHMFPAPMKAASSVHETSLNNGMDLWNSSHMNGGQNGILPTGQTTTNGLQKAVLENQITQDKRDQKRQKRKLSNRESARRSRERKQKECEDLGRQVAELNTQNNDLRVEIDKLNMECKNLETENASIAEELKQLYGPNVLMAIEGEKLSMSTIRILGVECNGHNLEGSSLIPMVYQNTTLLPTSNSKT